MLEELRQGFFQAYPDLAKNPMGTPAISGDKRLLVDICARYNSPVSGQNDNLTAAKQTINKATAAMKTNVVEMVANTGQAKVRTLYAYIVESGCKDDRSQHAGNRVRADIGHTRSDDAMEANQVLLDGRRPHRRHRRTHFLGISIVRP